ncbi:uncharacterized protein LOC100160646 isoform X2 [Acyrthosiphon pisum]|uniref:Solute carrier family 46 member 3 n=1 Tax=Acyrthosiphon pisum TaxID=7029 RepID=A0A8R2D4F7_ACYPI|nr:uncharacterized protein LOC100160646 isoform X2 [Acyrthosiphon pisum]|eukprot:XP_016660972.1 PREDICTED: uncharacterized protein LOC100160646 isoform X2 [Acyrthosiphon pisum]
MECFVTALYSVSLSMSAFFQNNLLLRKACNSSVPFGECTEGEAHAQHVVSTIYSWKAAIQYTIPVVIIILAGSSKNYSITLAALLMCQAVLVGRIGGEYAVSYLFMRFKFKWYEVEYSYFAAYKMLTIFFGTLFSVTVLSHRLKINDAIIGYIACTFDILAAVCYVFANEPWQLYIIPLIDFFHGTALTISTSLTSKIVENEKLGRLNSVQGLMSTFMSFILVSLYSATYNLTFEYLPGAVFLLNIILTFPLLIIFMIIYCKCKHMWTAKEITQS